MNEFEERQLYVRPCDKAWDGWSLMDDRKLIVDMICSVGGDCVAASQQKLRGMRPYALPFDWCYADGETAIGKFAAELRSDFRGMALRENLQPIPGLRNGYKDAATGYNFMHHFTMPVESEGEYERFKTTFDRRVNRLISEIERSGVILFLLSRVYLLQRECLFALEKACEERWPTKTFYYIMATYNSGKSTLTWDNNTMVVRIARDRNRYDIKQKVFEWSFLDNVAFSSQSMEKFKGMCVNEA